jgi:hypothetical protein
VLISTGVDEGGVLLLTFNASGRPLEISWGSVDLSMGDCDPCGSFGAIGGQDRWRSRLTRRDCGETRCLAVNGEDGRLRVRMSTSTEELDCCGGWISDAKDVRRVHALAETQEPSVANLEALRGRGSREMRWIK